MKNLQKNKELLVAHRGFRGLYGENRVVDFRNALKITGSVEFDIRLTKDKQIIIFHDHNFKRIGKVNKRVKSMTYEEIKTIPYFVKNKDDLPPLFEDFMKKYASKYNMMNVEIKPDYYTEEEMDIIFDSIKKFSKDTNIIVSSFGPSILKEIIKRRNNHFKTGYLFEKLSQFDKKFAKQFDFLHPPISLMKKPKNVKIFKDLKKPLNPWTFKKNQDVTKIHNLYGDLINGYISDFPDLYPKV